MFDILFFHVFFRGAIYAAEKVCYNFSRERVYSARLARESGAKRLLLTHLDGETEAAAATLERIVAAGIDFSPAMVVQDMGIMDI